MKITNSGWSISPSTVEIAATTSAVRLWPELPRKLHQAPDPGAVDLGGQPTDGSQVDAKESAHRSNGAAIGRPRSGPCQVPTEEEYRTRVREKNRHSYLPRPDGPLATSGPHRNG